MFHVFMFSRLILAHRYLHTLRLLFAQRQVIATEPEFDRVTQGSAADHFDVGAVAEAHFEQPPAEVGIAGNRDDEPAAAGAELVQGTNLRISATLVTTGQIAGIHGTRSPKPERLFTSS